MGDLQTIQQRVVAALTEIWNDHLSGSIYAIYRHNARVFYGLRDQIYGREQFLNAVIAVQAMLPDLTFSAEQVTSGRTPDDEAAVYVRWKLSGTHLGFGLLGEPTGRELTVTGMSISHLVDGWIGEQWNIIDSSTICSQLGIPEQALLGNLALDPPMFDPSPVGDSGRVAGQNTPKFPGSPGVSASPQETALFHLMTCWNLRSPGIVRQTHISGSTVAIPGNSSCDAEAYIAFAYSLIRIFPDLHLYIDETITEIDSSDSRAAVVAVRWTMQGLHGADGRYGPAADRRVTIPGISEFRIENGTIQAERMTFSELDLRRHLFPYQQQRAGDVLPDGEEPSR